jgi:hypothetical protein
MASRQQIATGMLPGPGRRFRKRGTGGHPARACSAWPAWWRGGCARTATGRPGWWRRLPPAFLRPLSRSQRHRGPRSGDQPRPGSRPRFTCISTASALRTPPRYSPILRRAPGLASKPAEGPLTPGTFGPWCAVRRRGRLTDGKGTPAGCGASGVSSSRAPYPAGFPCPGFLVRASLSGLPCPGFPASDVSRCQVVPQLVPDLPAPLRSAGHCGVPSGGSCTPGTAPKRGPRHAPASMEGGAGRSAAPRASARRRAAVWGPARYARRGHRRHPRPARGRAGLTARVFSCPTGSSRSPPGRSPSAPKPPATISARR